MFRVRNSAGPPGRISKKAAPDRSYRRSVCVNKPIMTNTCKFSPRSPKADGLPPQRTRWGHCLPAAPLRRSRTAVRRSCSFPELGRAPLSQLQVLLRDLCDDPLESVNLRRPRVRRGLGPGWERSQRIQSALLDLVLPFLETASANSRACGTPRSQTPRPSGPPPRFASFSCAVQG